jgi:hypothetical protein
VNKVHGFSAPQSLVISLASVWKSKPNASESREKLTFRLRPTGALITFWLEVALGKLTAACPYRKSNPDVLMVQSAQDRQAENAASRLNTARNRRILAQR